jgi:hypothetical protein
MRAEQMAQMGFGGGRGWGFRPGMSNMQRLRAVGNTNLFGTGMYMNLLFGGMESAHAVLGYQGAERFAMANPSDLEGQLQAWNTSIDKLGGGFLGSLAALPFGGQRDRISAVAASAAAANRLYDAREATRRRDIDVGGRLAIASTGGTDRMRAEADAAFLKASFEERDAYDAYAKAQREGLAATQAGFKSSESERPKIQTPNVNTKPPWRSFNPRICSPSR